MSSLTRIWLARHGEVEEAYHQVFGGSLDMDLSPLGLRQAAQLAEDWGNRKLDAVYTSPLMRARKTAQPISQQFGLVPEVLEDLRELDFGAWTGHHWHQVQEKFGVNAFDWLRELEQDRVAGAEPSSRFQERVGRALDQVAASHPGGQVLLVCHGGVIRVALASILRAPLSHLSGLEIEYGSLTLIVRTATRSVIELVNHTPWRTWP